MKKIYPWDRWFRQGQFNLRRGKDYSVRTYSMAQQIRTYAAAKELRIHLTITEDETTIKVKVLGRLENAAAC